MLHSVETLDEFEDFRVSKGSERSEPAKKKLMAFGFLKNNEKFYKDLKRVNVKKSYF